MPSKDKRHLLRDIIASIDYIRSFAANITFDQYLEDRKTRSAVERELAGGTPILGAMRGHDTHSPLLMAEYPTHLGCPIRDAHLVTGGRNHHRTLPQGRVAHPSRVPVDSQEVVPSPSLLIGRVAQALRVRRVAHPSWVPHP